MPPPKPRAKAAATLLTAAINEALRRGLFSLDSLAPVEFTHFDFAIDNTRFACSIQSVNSSAEENCEFAGEIEISCVISPRLGYVTPANKYLTPALLRKIAKSEASATGHLSRTPEKSWIQIDPNDGFQSVSVTRKSEEILDALDIRPAGYEQYGPNGKDWARYAPVVYVPQMK